MKGFNLNTVKELGKGSFARVFLTDDGYAAKMIDKRAVLNLPVNHECIKGEIDIHRTVDHPNIAKLYSVHETETHIILKLEYVDG